MKAMIALGARELEARCRCRRGRARAPARPRDRRPEGRDAAEPSADEHGRRREAARQRDDVRREALERIVAVGRPLALAVAGRSTATALHPSSATLAPCRPRRGASGRRRGGAVPAEPLRRLALRRVGAGPRSRRASSVRASGARAARRRLRQRGSAWMCAERSSARASIDRAGRRRPCPGAAPRGSGERDRSVARQPSTPRGRSAPPRRPVRGRHPEPLVWREHSGSSAAPAAARGCRNARQRGVDLGLVAGDGRGERRALRSERFAPLGERRHLAGERLLAAPSARAPSSPPRPACASTRAARAQPLELLDRLHLSRVEPVSTSRAWARRSTPGLAACSSCPRAVVRTSASARADATPRARRRAPRQPPFGQGGAPARSPSASRSSRWSSRRGWGRPRGSQATLRLWRRSDTAARARADDGRALLAGAAPGGGRRGSQRAGTIPA